MTLLSLPYDLSELNPNYPSFACALGRLLHAPTFVRAPSDIKWSGADWQHLKNSSAVIVLINGPIPSWVRELAACRPVGILTPEEIVASESQLITGVHTALLKGFEDLVESYRVLSQIVTVEAANAALQEEERAFLENLSRVDLFRSRPRLSFIPPIPLPQDLRWRPAAYLLNRLSNNVDNPSLEAPTRSPQEAGNASVLVGLLNYCWAACTVLAFIDLGWPVPSGLTVTRDDILGVHQQIADSRDDGEKFRIFTELGSKLTAKGSPALIISVPSARTDLLKRGFPPTLVPDSKEPTFRKICLQAIEDYIAERPDREFGAADKAEKYKMARETVLQEMRLMCVQTAFLGNMNHGLPILTQEIGGKLYGGAVKAFYDSFASNSRKRAEEFRKLELTLASVLPAEIVEMLSTGESPITFYSDLPFEWTALEDGWPLCLTRPVSRIPVAATNAWSNLGYITNSEVVINTDHPERVLVLDLIEKHDRVRYYSDLFQNASAGIGQHYRYESPTSLGELHRLLVDSSIEVVVLDTHGSYKSTKDQLNIYLGRQAVEVHDFLPRAKIPPVWLLAACDTATVGAVSGTLTCRLFDRGALAVVATCHKINADLASLFVGKVLAEIYSPASESLKRSTLLDAFFNAQLTTACLYDQLLPLMRRIPRLSAEGERLMLVIADFLGEMLEPLPIKEYRLRAAAVLHDVLKRHGLLNKHRQLVAAGSIAPETLLYSAFGLPSRVRLN